MYIKIENYDLEVNKKGLVREFTTKAPLKTFVPYNPKSKQGYVHVSRRNLTTDKWENLTVHRLVARAFIPNPFGKPTVNHIDGDGHNNYVENLEWATHGENIQHAYDNGLMDAKKGHESHMSRIDENQAREVLRLLRGGYRQKDIEDITSVPRSTIKDLAVGRTWKSLCAEYGIVRKSKRKKMGLSTVRWIFSQLQNGRSVEWILENANSNAVTRRTVVAMKNRKCYVDIGSEYKF